MLLLEYGLLVALFLPNCAREGDEEMRWRPCSSLARPLSFAGASMGMASECSIGMAGLLSTSGTNSGTAVSIAGVGEDSCDGRGVGRGAEGGSVTVGTPGPAAAHGRGV